MERKSNDELIKLIKEMQTIKDRIDHIDNKFMHIELKEALLRCKRNKNVKLGDKDMLFLYLRTLLETASVLSVVELQRILGEDMTEDHFAVLTQRFMESCATHFLTAAVELGYYKPDGRHT